MQGFGEWVRAERKSRGWNQAELAVKAALSTATIIKVEAGDPEVQKSTVRLLGLVLQATVEEIDAVLAGGDPFKVIRNKGRSGPRLQALNQLVRETAAKLHLAPEEFEDRLLDWYFAADPMVRGMIDQVIANAPPMTNVPTTNSRAARSASRPASPGATPPRRPHR